jgi:murein DD-endopeptidase MepM/ murein hydrolase activator NlpD
LTFASIYNGTANAPTYKQIIENYANIFNGLISLAQAPTPPVAPTPVQPAPVQPAPKPVEPSPAPPITVIGPTPPPSTTSVVVASTVEGLNVRSGSSTQAPVIATLGKNQQVSALESAENVRSKTARPSSDNQWINIRLDDGRTGFVAAWLVTQSAGIAKADIDSFIDSIPDRFEIPAEYDTLWAAQDRVGLPDPFNELPIQITTQSRIVNLTINGFGPNSFALQNWTRYYSNTAGMHNGYDYIVETGTPLRAVADGVIVRNWPFLNNPADKTVMLWCYLPAQFKDTSGNRQMSNVLVAYAHLSNNDLKKEGDIVKAGDVIGISGTPAGESDNDHLHIEVHLLAGDTPLRKSTRRLLALYQGDQPNDSFTPFNPLLFFSKRLIKYHLQQGFSRGYAGLPAYPTAETLGQQGAAHLGLLDQFTLAYYQYGSSVVWKNAGKPWPTGVITLRMLPDRLPSFPTWTAYSLAQKG